jgi:hypothetical protein
LRLHVAYPYICLVNWALIRRVVVLRESADIPKPLYIGLLTVTKCSGEVVTLAKRKRRQKANEDPHDGW